MISYRTRDKKEESLQWSSKNTFQLRWKTVTDQQY